MQATRRTNMVLNSFLSYKRSLPIQSKIVLYIILLIGCQQFPVIHIGGSLKIYEVLGLCLLFYGIKRRKDKLTTLLFWFFIVSPLLSLISFYLCDDVSSFFSSYPQANGKFRYDIYVFPILQLFYMFANYVVLYKVYCDKHLYRGFDLVIKWVVIIGTVIAFYSIVAMFAGDPISHLPSFLQSKHYYEFRSSGLSQEPSNYILYQGWIVLLCWCSRRIFDFRKWVMMFSLNILSLMLTFSSTLVLYVCVIVLIILLFSKTRQKIAYISLMASVLWVVYFTMIKYVDMEMLNFAMVQKV